MIHPRVVEFSRVHCFLTNEYKAIFWYCFQIFETSELRGRGSPYRGLPLACLGPKDFHCLLVQHNDQSPMQSCRSFHTYKIMYLPQFLSPSAVLVTHPLQLYGIIHKHVYIDSRSRYMYLSQFLYLTFDLTAHIFQLFNSTPTLTLLRGEKLRVYHKNIWRKIVCFLQV